MPEPLLTLNIEEAKLVRGLFAVLEYDVADHCAYPDELTEEEQLLIDKLDMFLK